MVTVYCIDLVREIVQEVIHCQDIGTDPRSIEMMALGMQDLKKGFLIMRDEFHFMMDAMARLIPASEDRYMRVGSNHLLWCYGCCKFEAHFSLN